MGILHKQPPFENVGANSTAILPRLDMGETCDTIILELGGTFTKTHLLGIRVMLGGKTIWDLTGLDLDDINKYMNRTTEATLLALHFADPNARTILGESIGGVDTSLGYSSFGLEVDIGGATSPTLAAWMVKSRPKAADSPHRPMFRAFLKATESISAAGTYNLRAPVGSDMGNLLARLHLMHANITQFDVKKGGLELQGNGKNSVVQFLQNELNRTAQSGHLVYDPMFDNNQSNAVATVKPNGRPATMEFKATISGSDTIVVYSELYTTLDRA